MLVTYYTPVTYVLARVLIEGSEQAGRKIFIYLYTNSTNSSPYRMASLEERLAQFLTVRQVIVLPVSTLSVSRSNVVSQSQDLDLQTLKC